MIIQIDPSKLPEIYLFRELDFLYCSTIALKKCGEIPNLKSEQCVVLKKNAAFLFEISENLYKLKIDFQKSPPLQKSEQHEQFNKIESDIDHVNQQRQILHWLLLFLIKSGGSDSDETKVSGGSGGAELRRKVNINSNKSSSSDGNGVNCNKNKEEEGTSATSTLVDQTRSNKSVSTSIFHHSMPDDLEKLNGMAYEFSSYQGPFAADYYKPIAPVLTRIVVLLAASRIDEAKQLYLENKSLFHSIDRIRTELDAHLLFEAWHGLIKSFEDRGVSFDLQ